MMERQWGYALDIACVYGQRYPQDAISPLLRDLPVNLVMRERRKRKARSVVAHFVPSRMKGLFRRAMQR